MCKHVALLKQHICGTLQACELVPDEVQNQLMLLAIQDVAKVISIQAAATPAGAPAAGGKPAAKPTGGKAKKDESKPVQVLLSCAVLCCAMLCIHSCAHAAGSYRAAAYCAYARCLLIMSVARYAYNANLLQQLNSF